MQERDISCQMIAKQACAWEVGLVGRETAKLNSERGVEMTV